MQAMLLDFPAPIREAPLHAAEMPPPAPGPGQALVRVSACALSHTDLQTVEGELPLERLPIIIGHQVVGRVAELGPGARRFKVGERVGLGRLFHACGACVWCNRGREHLCREAQFTGLHRDGGLAEYLVAAEDFLLPLSEAGADAQVAPLLGLGFLAHRAVAAAGLEPGGHLGIFGWGAAEQLALALARAWDCRVSVFTRNLSQQDRARSLGASWAGYPDDPPPALVDSAVVFPPAGALVPAALQVLNRGGALAAAGLHLGPIPHLSFDRHLAQEKTLRSVTGGSRRDLQEFLGLAAKMALTPRVQTFPLAEANRALQLLKAGKIDGAAVLQP